MARADFLERVRRYSFLVTLAFAVYLGYSAYSGQVVLRLGDYRGVYNTAWLSALMTLVTTTFLSLVGFYVVRNSVDRDQQTGVGRILAATPMTRLFYTAAKVASNFAVLSAMVLVLMGAAIIMHTNRVMPSVSAWSKVGFRSVARDSLHWGPMLVIPSSAANGLP